MYFNNGRRVSINKGSNNNSGNNNNNSQQNNNNDKKDTSSPFGGLKQPKAGKRRVRGNSGGNAKDIDIFADLNDLALNPEDWKKIREYHLLISREFINTFLYTS